ncbi:MAG: hypothetical protein ABI846_15075 [Rudaea sp.]
MREAFIPFFESAFIESQEVVGNKIVGQFRDLDRPDHLTRPCGFRDTRSDALQAFYGGDVWRAHRDEAIDSDNVLLLRATRPPSAFALADLRRARAGATDDPKGLLGATIHSFPRPVDPQFMRFFEGEVLPVLGNGGHRCDRTKCERGGRHQFPASAGARAGPRVRLVRDVQGRFGPRASLATPAPRTGMARRQRQPRRARLVHRSPAPRADTELATAWLTRSKR